MRKTSALVLVVFLLGSMAQAITFFERNSLSLHNISDIPIATPPMPGSVPMSPDNSVISPPGANDGYQGAPEIPGGNGEIGGGDGDRGGDFNRGDRGDTDPGTGGQNSQQNGDGTGDADGKTGTPGRSGTRTEGEREGRDQENRDRESRERESRERENRDQDTKDRESRDREAREREARERETKAKDGKGKAKKGNGRDTSSKPSSGGGPRFIERGGALDNYKEMGRVAEGPSGTMSDMPTKYFTKRTREAPLPYWPIAATTIGTPSAHGADWTDVFAGVGVQNRGRYGTLPNSTAIVGMGFGDAQRNVGLEVGISSFGLIRHGLPFTTGGVSLKLHHYFTDWKLGVAAGYENAIYWGAPDSGQSFFLVFSKYILIGKGAKHEPFRTLFVHAGIGDGRFRTEANVIAGRNSISPFLAVALRAADPINMIANWTGSDLSLGVSVTPFRSTPLGIGISAMDVLRTAGDGVRFSMVFSYGDSTQNPTFPVDWFRSSSTGRN